MADTGPDAETPYPVVVTDENLLFCLHTCLRCVASFTMQHAHYKVFRAIVDQLDAKQLGYEEFREQMVALLQQNSSYAHLEVYWDVFDRVIHGEERILQDDFLFLYPVALYVLLNLIHHSAEIRDPLWNVEPKRVLASQREMSRIHGHRYRTAGEDPIRVLDPDLNPEWNLYVLLDWFQDCGAGIVMGTEDYDCFAKLLHDVSRSITGRQPDEVMAGMRVLLRSPYAKFVQLWWHIHRKKACGVRRIVEYPIARFPLALYFTWNIVLHLAMSRYTLWNLFLNTVRRHYP